MSDKTESALPTPTLEERVTAIEHQSFILYLQLNALTKIFVEDKKLVTRDELMSSMEEIHKKVNEVTEEYVKSQAEIASAEETPAE